MISSLTPGKLILLGEYAVLEGAPAIVSAIDKYVRITLSESVDNRFCVNAPNLNIFKIHFEVDNNSSIIYIEKLNDLKLSQLQLFTNIFTYLYNYCKDKNKKLIPCNITIDSSEFYFEDSNLKIGLGSSAAITVGLIKALLKFNDINISKTDELFHLAMNAHYHAQDQIGSGIDIAASTYGSLGVYQRSNQSFSFRLVTSPSNLSVIPIWTGSSTSTPQFVTKTNQLKKTDPERYYNLINGLSELSENGSKCFIQNDLRNYLKIVDQFYHLLIDLGENAGIPIISETHMHIANIIKDCGGFYKPSGAGGSDIGIAFTDNIETKNSIIEKIKKSPFKYIKLKLNENKNVG